MKKSLLSYQLSLSEIAINNANEHSEASIATGLNSTHQEYAATYHKSTSLYFFRVAKNKAKLIIYDTESEREVKVKKLKIPKKRYKLYHFWCVVQLPKAELFCLVNHPYFGSALIIDKDYRVRKLPSGPPCEDLSITYFKGSIYCFGGRHYNEILNLSRRFDLNTNRWIELTPMPRHDKCCNSIAFNSNILISNEENQKLLLYSVEIDSFTEIPYNFGRYMRKILINAEERLYLFECDNLAIYESRIGDEYAWEIIGNSTIYFLTCDYWTYNKGEIYIGFDGYDTRHYYKFNLDQKKLTELKKKNKRACECNIF